MYNLRSSRRTMELSTVFCPICQSEVVKVGSKRGDRFGAVFHVFECKSCLYRYVSNPSTDYNKIYDEDYYAGKGSDPMIDYSSEYFSPNDTVRRHDWEGIEIVVDKLRPGGGRWLDYGCGNGSLVRAVSSGGNRPHKKRWEILGFDVGSWTERARADGLPILTEDSLARMVGTFDVITAIEVIEHVHNPVDFLRKLRTYLKPGGLLFITTLNAEVSPGNFLDWGYLKPEIHISFFTPKSLSLAMDKSGFRPIYPGFISGWEKIIRFKVLKNLGVRRHHKIHSLIPWSLVSRLVDLKFRVTRLPVGVAS